jgi:hypothetical protein
MTININQIIVWQNSSIPENWVICDGNNGTPDLRGMFVYGKYDDSDTPISSSSVEHSHVGGVSSTASNHTHDATLTLSSPGGDNHYTGSTSVASATHTHSASVGLSSAGAHSHTTTLANANGLPNYMLLYYIMKVA